ncbi:Uncharacterized protein OS=Pirellula staleyi (strain ATCC 27377 / DSM 6068 / ICPB 4128) GN=Psta_2333 PE=4 SV=1: DUF3108 [Gemmata massiliana]|uniref:DUF3108 domain-containing protein n=2 Tax=Gemmata massiliana TaxID=1210884 RepID=A0A6P2CWB3_9BACT|nr:Uncharacterized protein OS=Pirellula staleyi (strain ATCC 27377 / DSM 6068 / ICPB 4128) GN=Psta_2333 PE=4 SV=1: DUF3108 [Gemmata massiliana]
MIRLIVVLFTPVALIGLAPAAPVPKHLMPKEPLYYSVQKGTRWVYTDNGTDCEYEATDVKPLARDGWTVTVECVRNGAKSPDQKLEVSPRGLVLIESRGISAENPLCLLQRPTEPNAEWSYRRYNPGTTYDRGTMTVTGTEDVKVPAGAFRAVRVVHEVTVMRGDKPVHQLRVTSWYAPDVGLVKATGEGYKLELKSFTPGKG